MLSALESEGESRHERQVSTWACLRRSSGAMIGLVLIVLLLLTALTADLVASQRIDDQDLRKGLLPPSREFPLGTDEFGRDMLSRIIHGSRISLQVAIVTAAISAVLGVALGAIAGYVGGSVDYVIQGMVDISWAFPTVLLGIFLVAVLGCGLANVMFAVGLGYWGGFARVVCGQVLSFLSLLGMGAQPPVPSWGSILSSGRTYLRLAPWVTLFPGIAIMLTVLGFNLLGDGLRDALDPRLRNL